MIKTYIKENREIIPNFNLLEFACKDGSEKILIDDKLLTQLTILRNLIQVPIIINSAYRTESYNKKIKGAKNSYHCKGQAVDIRTNTINNNLLALYCAKLFNGIIVYKNFVHCDTRNEIYYEIKE